MSTLDFAFCAGRKQLFQQVRSIEGARRTMHDDRDCVETLRRFSLCLLMLCTSKCFYMWRRDQLLTRKQNKCTRSLEIRCRFLWTCQDEKVSYAPSIEVQSAIRKRDKTSKPTREAPVNLREAMIQSELKTAIRVKISRVLFKSFKRTF